MDSTVIAAPATLIVTYLEMTARSDFHPSFLLPEESQNLTVMPMIGIDLPFYRFLYGSVGGQWRWRDRLIMPDDKLTGLLAAPGTTIHVLYVNGIPAGYFELRAGDAMTEIGYFGLRAHFFGRGLGKHLLSLAIQQAWDDGARRVQVHTCNMDGPYALQNYIRRGFRVFNVTEEPLPELYA